MSIGNQMLAKAMISKKTDMQMNEVKSSNVSHVGYDSHNQTLAITFKNGKTYHYDDVPSDIHGELMKAESVGKFIAGNIVDKFKHKLIE